ncbi:cilia- and flagella-associated protein 61 isoform X2 [Oryzias melastigma]|uniref:cilia- and flagella-associated protein 61 isoform X2 n=1 Tax=Oryzias melastigma TaxID=30732 RepID=UPI000CF82683|nr:cilia- and flagella-associated protein 61 isoform X2 [Oryzias melastigma]
MRRRRLWLTPPFFDYPVGDLVDQAQWECFLHKHFISNQCTSLNTLFLHLFVAREGFATTAIYKIMRTAFQDTPEVKYICLVSPNVADLEPPLQMIFEPFQSQTTPALQCLAFVCCRERIYGRLHMRSARPSDHNRILDIVGEKTDLSSLFDQLSIVKDFIEAESEHCHSVTFEVDKTIIGLITVADLDDLESDHFDLRQFEGFYKTQEKQDEAEVNLSGEEPSRETTSTLEERETQMTETPPEKHNSFCIKVLLTDQRSDLRSVESIQYLFQLFPHLDYCVLTSLPSCNEFGFLQNFLRVPTGPTDLSPSELYIFHRSGLGRMEVRKAVGSDRPAVSNLVKDLSCDQSLLQDLDSFYNDPYAVMLQAFVAQMDAQIVGILIIKDEQDTDYLRAHYNIENFISFSQHRPEEHAHVRHFVLRPLLRLWSQPFFREVLRLAHKSCLYYRTYPRHYRHQVSCVNPLDFVLDCAVPISPRRQIIYPLEELGNDAPSRRLTEEQEPFALSLICRKLTLEPRININTRIVVVGASDTGLSFLETLCLRPHLKFNNLTLISTRGFPGDYDHEDMGFLSTSHAYNSKDLAKMHFNINVVKGKMVRIDRKSKYVLVSGVGMVPYDHLILCTGLQYRALNPTVKNKEGPIKKAQLLRHSTKHTNARVVPSNLFTLNDVHDCMAARHWLCANFLDQSGNAVIYGNNIDVYISVETLLSLGIPGSRIHLVLPPEPAVCALPNSVVERAVAAAMENAGVHVHRNFVLAQMSTDTHPDPLTSVTFTKDSRPLHLQCGVFFNLSCKEIDLDVLESIQKSFLVLDDRLVIRTTFLTNDPAIYGAGPLTKFSRWYRSDEWSHANFNSKEVGQELADALLSRLDPALQKLAGKSPKETRLVPIYRRAKIQGGKLPGGFNFLHVTKPSPTKLKCPFQPSTEIVTGGETGDYFCIKLNHHGVVETIICLSLEPLPVSNYLSLYGKHELLLGGLLRSHRQGEIQDLYSFFRQRKCMPIFHDRYSDLEKELQEKVKLKSDGGEPAAGGRPSLDAEGRTTLRKITGKFLSENKDLLPMFLELEQL